MSHTNQTLAQTHKYLILTSLLALVVLHNSEALATTAMQYQEEANALLGWKASLLQTQALHSWSWSWSLPNANATSNATTRRG